MHLLKRMIDMTTLTASQMLASGRRRTAGVDRFMDLRALVARMAANARAKHARRELRGLSDHLLRDMGLSRADIETMTL